MNIDYSFKIENEHKDFSAGSLEKFLNLKEICEEVKKQKGVSICDVTMHWNEAREQFSMRLVLPPLFLQEFTEEELKTGEKEVFDCGTICSLFKGLDKKTKKKYKLIAIQIE